jgi:TRAP-type C4-dicarboxylate transport system permease small subunit
MPAKKIARLAAGVLDTLAAISVAVVVALMVFLIFARFANISVVGIFEIIGLFAMASYMFGAATASRRHQHLVVDWLNEKLTDPRHRAIQQFVVALCTVLATALFVYWTYRMLAWGMKRPQFTPSFGIPMWVPQLSLVVGSVGCLIYALRDVVNSLGALRKTKGS